MPNPSLRMRVTSRHCCHCCGATSQLHPSSPSGSELHLPLSLEIKAKIWASAPSWCPGPAMIPWGSSIAVAFNRRPLWRCTPQDYHRTATHNLPHPQHGLGVSFPREAGCILPAVVLWVMRGHILGREVCRRAKAEKRDVKNYVRQVGLSHSPQRMAAK